MSNEFVMVPRELAEVAARALSNNGYDLQALDLESVLAEQHQGEPVALPEHKNAPPLSGDQYGYGWNACLDEIAKLGPLYTHADPGEVERLRAEIERMRERVTPTHKSLIGKHAEIIKERDSLRQQVSDLTVSGHQEYMRCEKMRAQLAERDALLREAITVCRTNDLHMTANYFESKLYASAEPSAPTPMPAHMEAACDKFDWTPEEALRFYAEGKHFDTDNGRTRILCTGAIASHALKGMSKKYADLKGSEQAEPSAPVERDERAAFEKAVVDKAERFHPNLEQYGENPDADYRDASIEWAWGLWQARAALERKA